MKTPTRVELLAPAGNLEKLETAVHFGADAVYLSGKHISLRNFATNFSLDEIAAAVAFSHRHDVKIYVACNIYYRDHEEKALRSYLCSLAEIRPDAVIVADPGIFLAARELMPHIPLHISTQANTTNAGAAVFWRRLGVDRIIAARELSLSEITRMVKQSGIFVEVFVHGSMCIAYSGRCLLSTFLALRDSNRGRCAHPCRWQYAVVEEKRPGQYLPLMEDLRGSYIFNAQDLCMIDHIPELVASGVCALKIEGRMRGIHYVAATVKAYREAIDAYYQAPAKYRPGQDWCDLLNSDNQRGYCTGFYFGDPRQAPVNPQLTCPTYAHRLVGRIRTVDLSGRASVDVRNRLVVGEAVEILTPGRPLGRDVIAEMTDGDGNQIDVSHAGMRVHVHLHTACGPNDLLRRRSWNVDAGDALQRQPKAPVRGPKP